MVVKKSDILSSDASRIKTALAKHEEHADNQLNDAGHARIRLEGEKRHFRNVLGAELKRKYEEAGWTVSINSGSSQRDGDWYQISIS